MKRWVKIKQDSCLKALNWFLGKAVWNVYSGRSRKCRNESFTKHLLAGQQESANWCWQKSNMILDLYMYIYVHMHTHTQSSMETFSAGLWQAFCVSECHGPHLRYKIFLGNCCLAVSKCSSTSAMSAFPFAVYLLVFCVNSKLAHSQYLWLEKHQIKLRHVLGELCLNQDKQFDKTVHLSWSTSLAVSSVSKLHALRPEKCTCTSHINMPPMFPAMRSDSPQAGFWRTRARSLPRGRKPHCFCGLQLQGRKSGVLPLGQHGLCLFRSQNHRMILGWKRPLNVI